jgi:flagellar basal-body rod modification protein FlgD
MTVSSVGNAAATLPSATDNASTPSAAPTLGYDEFLQLLLAQMKNQDPLNPTDSTQYVSQLASFSSVEQAVKQNAKLDQLLVMNSISQASSVVGHIVTSADGASSGEVRSVRVDSSGTVATLTNGSEITLGPGVSVANS